jgi:hypothetical protein
MERVGDGADADGECGFDGVDGIFGAVLVRGELTRD